MRLRAFLACLFVTASGAAMAFDRPFPQDVKRGKMTPAAHPHIVIDGKPRAMAPGGRIWNQDNLIEMPAALRGRDLAVNYTETDDGQIDRVWILTPQEASEPVADQRKRALTR